ncbi:E3 SUMO-protein ligase ZBED1-like [Haliotis cracherodii]|uniref:E3 SUMO-protein ligase ZBED1-like n=1 Tax=Haliotis cracherodii TaxID=6455 RepID=UPI0039EB4EF4
MIVAVREAGLTHVKCFAHTVNLASQRALKIDRVNRLLKKLRTIVVFFHRSTVANALLKQKQGMLQLPDHKLIQDVSTRWNSSFEMVERYLEQQPAVLSVLMSKDVRKTEKDVVLYETDLSNAEDLVVVLKPMKTITTILCDEKQPTISLIFPLKHQILQLMQVIEGDTAFVRDIKEAIIQDINKRYIDEEDYLLLTSAVDPRFLSLPQLDDERKLAVFSSLITKAATLVNSDKIMKVKQEPDDGVATRKPELPELPGPDLNQDKAPAVTPVTVKQESSAMEELFGDVFVTHVQPAKSTLQLLEEEVSVYKGEECIPLLCDPLEWWCENQYRFPLLPRLAKSLLCIPGTSVPSERIFSTAGDIVTAQRATSSCDHVNMLIFLKKNLKQ